MSVVDIASGPGGLSASAAEAGAQVLATDISEAMVERVAQRLQPYPNCTVRVMDAQQPPLQDGFFYAAFSLFGVVNVPDWRGALRELARVTRTDGYGTVRRYVSRPMWSAVRADAALRGALPSRPRSPCPSTAQRHREGLH